MEKDIRQTIDYKQAAVKANMDRKELGIFLSGSIRDAVMITNTLLEKGKIKDIKAEFEKWQKYFFDFAQSKLPTEPECATCGAKMKTSQAGSLYCPEYYNPKNEKHHPPQTLTSNEEKFINTLPK